MNTINKNAPSGNSGQYLKDLSDQASINSNDTHKFNLKLENAIEAIQDFQFALAEYALHTDKPHYSIVECADAFDEAERALLALKGAL